MTRPLPKQEISDASVPARTIGRTNRSEHLKYDRLDGLA